MKRVNQILFAFVLISLGMLLQCIRGGFQPRDGAIAAGDGGFQSRDGAPAPGQYAKLTVREGTLDSGGNATECGSWSADHPPLMLWRIKKPGEGWANGGFLFPAPRNDGCIAVVEPTNPGGNYRLWVIE